MGSQTTGQVSSPRSCVQFCDLLFSISCVCAKMGFLTKSFRLQQMTIRQFGINVYRLKKGLAPRYAYSPLSETSEFSYMDGKGFAPLNKQQKLRHERDQKFAATIVKHLKEFELAKRIHYQQQQPQVVAHKDNNNKVHE